jgi:phage repressor protein C with HTH and peptisase S24 domain
MDYNRYYMAIRQKLDHLIKSSASDDYASISLLIGKNHAYIQQFIKRGVPKCLNNDDLQKIETHFGTDFGQPDDYPANWDTLEKKSIDNNYIFVKLYDIEASAGAGSFDFDNNTVIQKLAFKKSWIRSSSNATEDDLAVITVSGDSMSPTLLEGDRILVDMTQQTLNNDGIYVLRSDGRILVKRVSSNPITNLCTIKSDNPYYESWNDCEPSKLDIIGRVIWMGRTI